MSELKPCPLCGSEVGWVSGSIRCSRCGLSYRPSPTLSKEKVERRWNTRPERTCRNVHEPPKDSAFWPAPHFKCSECGAVHVSVDYVFYCPNCGARVEVEE